MLPDGRVDALEAGRWVLANLCSLNAEATRQAAREMVHRAHTWNVLLAAAAEIPVAIVQAAAEEGATRAQAEEMANLALLFWGLSMDEALEPTGVPEVGLPHPEL